MSAGIGTLDEAFETKDAKPTGDPFSAMMRSRYWRWLSPQYVMRELLSLDDTAHAIALGAAVGMWVGLTPTVGLQITLVIGFWLLIRRVCYFNVTAGMLTVMVSNPLTTPPIYWGSYKLGMLMLGGRGELQFGKILEFNGLAGWWETVCTLFVQAGWPLLLGSLVLATAIAVPTYFATFWLCRRFRSTTSAPGHEVLKIDAARPHERGPHDAKRHSEMHRAV